MMKHSVRSVLLLLVVTFTLGPLVAGAQEATVAPTQIATDVRKHLLSLPYYGVFDLLTLNVDSSDVVTIAGYVLSDSLKKDAEREAREAKGVKEVHNKIAVAPVLPMDDDIRHGVYLTQSTAIRRSASTARPLASSGRCGRDSANGASVSAGAAWASADAARSSADRVRASADPMRASLNQAQAWADGSSAALI